MLNKKVYSHFLIMEKGLNFIRENAHHPFFAYFAITPPHADLDYPDLGQYEDAFPETPFINNKQKGFKTQMKPKAAYASMVSEIDKNVGQIIRLLKEKGIWENTIFIFSSDNGVHCVGGHEPDFFDSNGPYRGYKRDLYEGGVRAPFIVNWPKMIKEKKTVEHITAFWDFLPTVTELVGAEKVKGIDGISYLPLLIGNGDVARNHEYIYYEFYEQGGKQSILKDGWKLVRLNMSKPGELQEELYYLPDDVGEVLAVDRPGGDLLVSFAPPGLDNGTAWSILCQGRKGEQIAGSLIVLHNQSIVRLLRRKLRIQRSFRRSRLSFLPEAQLCQPGGLFRQFLLDKFLFKQFLFHGFCRSRQCAEHQQHRHDKAQKSLHALPSLQKSAGKSRRDRTSRYPYTPVPHRSRGALGARSWPTFWLVFSGRFRQRLCPAFPVSQ